jgi:hypothetical protein
MAPCRSSVGMKELFSTGSGIRGKSFDIDGSPQDKNGSLFTTPPRRFLKEELLESFEGKRMQQRRQLDDRPVSDGGILYDNDDPVSDDEAQILPARLRHAIFVDDPNIPADARVLVDNRSLDR